MQRNRGKEGKMRIQGNVYFVLRIRNDFTIVTNILWCLCYYVFYIFINSSKKSTKKLKQQKKASNVEKINAEEQGEGGEDEDTR